MKKLFLVLTILAIVFPSVAKTEQSYDFNVIGHGPLGDQLGMPMAVCSMKDGSIAVFDVSTSSITVFDPSGKVTRKTRVSGQSVNPNVSLESMPMGGIITPVSFDCDDSGRFYLINNEGLLKVGDDGGTSTVINFGAISPAVKKPVMLHIFKNNFYVLDQTQGILIFNQNGKYQKTVGTIGTGSGKAANPVNFWVGFDGKLLLLDQNTGLTESPTATTEMLILSYDANGTLTGEFGPAGPDPAGGDSSLIMPWVGATNRTHLYIVDIAYRNISIAWVVKQYTLSGDFVKSWIIIDDPKSGSPNVIRNLITSMDAGEDGMLAFAMPFRGSAFKDLSVFQLVGMPAENDCLKFPAAAVTSQSGMTYALDVFPPILHVYDQDGKQVKQKTIIDNYSDFPGFDFTIGTDIALGKGEIFVCTGLRVLKLDEKTLELIDSVEYSNNPLDTNIINSIFVKEKTLFALNTSGMVTVSSLGVPISFDAKTDMNSENLTDISIDKDGNINILDPKTKKIGVFTISGSFLRKIELSADNFSSTSISCLPTGEIAVLDGKAGLVRIVAGTGTVLSTAGKSGIVEKLVTEEDYKKNPGDFNLPTHITTNADGLMTVVDFGNCRIQTIKNAAPIIPEKKPAKLAVSKAKLDFGKVYYENDGVTLQFEVENMGEVELSGIINTKSTKVKVSPKNITADTSTVNVTFVPDRQLAWKKFTDTLTLETNGGTIEVKVEADVVGKVIKMTIGNTVFEVTTDKTETVSSTRAPEIISGRTYVPLRATGEVFGASVDWDAAEKKVTYRLDERVIELWISKDSAKVNGNSVSLPNPPLILNSSTYVPIRFVSEQLGAKVDWDGPSKTATITYPAP